MEYYEILPGVGSRVEKFRRQENETVNSLSKAIGVSPSYTSRLLKDKKAWNPEQIREVAKHYGISVEYLCTGVSVGSEQRTDYDYEAILGDAILHLEMLPKADRMRISARVMHRLINLMENCSD